MTRLACVRCKYKRALPSEAFSLVEMAIALAIISITFLSLVGLMGLGLASDQNSSQQTGATNIANSIIADLRSTPSYATSLTSTRYKYVLPTTQVSSATPFTDGAAKSYFLYFDPALAVTPVNATPSVSAMATPPASGAYVAKVYLAQIASVPTNVIMVRVVVSWPVGAATPAGSLEVITQFLLR